MTTIASVRQGNHMLLVEVDGTVSPAIARAARQLGGPKPAGHKPAGQTAGQDDDDGFANVSAVDRVVDSVKDVQTLIRETSEVLMEAFDNLAGHPERVSAEFGIKFAGEAGVPVITKASAEATLKLTIEWKREPAGK